MIELKNVSKYYNSSGVVSVGLRNIDLKLKKGEIVAIVGDSGSGKSTLLNVICCVDTYEEGEMYFNGEETSHFNQNDMDVFRKENVGFIYQNYNIIDSYSVLENVMLPLVLKGDSEADARKRALELIEQVGLSHRVNNKGTKLSGGEKQRCVIARALAADCSILACDEPTGNLDSESGKEIIKLIKEVSKDKLVLIVTHNEKEIDDIITRKIKISDGMIVEDHIIKEVTETKVDEFKAEKKIRKRDLLRISLNNIKSTPRKTFFSFMVFFCISLVAFYLYLTCMAASETSVFNPDGSFKNLEYNRLLIFNYDHSPLDDQYKKVEGIYYENPFYEDMSFAVSIGNQDGENAIVNIVYTKYNMKYTHIGGNEAVNSGEAYLIIPKETLDNTSIKLTPLIGEYMKIGSKKLKFVGFGTSENVGCLTMISPDDLVDEVCSYIYINNLTLTVTIPGRDVEIKAMKRNDDVEKPTIIVSQGLYPYIDEFELNFTIGGIYEIVNPVNDIEYREIFVENIIYFIMPNDYIYEFNNNVYEVSFYAERPNEAAKELEAMGYTVIRPSVYYSEITQNQMMFIIYVVASTLIVFALGIISVAVLLRIYNAKIKQYTVFRSLGVVEKQMNFLILLEFLFVSLLAILLAYLTVYIIYWTFEIEYLNVIRYNNFTVSLIYFIVMLLFVLFVVSRFNKRLYKYSVQNTFKDEVSK